MTKSIKEQLTERIAQAAGVDVGQVKLEYPELQEHGDYSTNIALTMGGSRPMAERIAAAIKPDKVMAKCEVAGSGFLNIWLQSNYLVNVLHTVLTQGQNFGKGLALDGKRVMVEFTDPNPFKEFHIGHLYSNIVGEALSRLMEFQGAEIWRGNYQGDV